MRVLVVMGGPHDNSQRDAQKRRYPPLFGRLKEMGVELYVALLGDRAGLRSDLAPAATEVHSLPAVPPSFRGLTMIPFVAPRIRHLLHRVQPDLIEGVEPLPTVAAALATLGNRRSLVLYRRQHQASGRALLLASKTAARLTDATVVSSREMLNETLIDDRTPSSRVFVTRSGTEDLRTPASAEIAHLRRELGIAQGSVVLGVISRLRFEKGIDLLLEAVDGIAGRRIDVVVAGAGPDETRLRSLARGCRTSIRFVGHQSDVAVWYGLSDVIVIPSRKESFGVTTVEAMAAGRPIVAARVGGLVEAIEHGVNGLLVDPESPRSLASALGRLVEDDELRHRMGKASRSRFEERYTMQAMAASWLTVWNRVIDRQGLGHPVVSG